jgi:cytochrome P450
MIHEPHDPSTSYEIREFDPEDDPALHHDHFSSFDRMREETAAFYSSVGEGFWVLTRGETIRKALQDYETFSNRLVFIKKQQVRDGLRYIPEQLDPPEHTKYRQLLTPLFAPAAVDKLEGHMREWCGRLISGLKDRREVDLMSDFARHYPTAIFVELMGLDVARVDELVDMAITLNHLPASEDADGARKKKAYADISQMLWDVIAQRRDEPRDDILTYLIGCEVDGRPLTDDELWNISFLLYSAGLDTVAGALGYFFLYLAQHPEQRRRIVRDPSLVPDAVEELLRFHSAVAPGRLVVRDVEIEGCPMREGDMVYMPLSCANRDPREWEGAYRVDFGRSPNRHIAFGAGPHRCLGSHLARRELQVALEMWHEAMPDYRVADGADLTETVTGLSTLHSLRLVVGESA